MFCFQHNATTQNELSIYMILFMQGSEHVEVTEGLESIRSTFSSLLNADGNLLADNARMLFLCCYLIFPNPFCFLSIRSPVHSSISYSNPVFSIQSHQKQRHP